MKNILCILAIALLFISCNNNKGWTARDRQKFIDDCTGAAVQMGRDKAKAYCECMQPKVEAKYATVAEANRVTSTEFSKPEWVSEVKKCLGMNDNSGENPIDNINNNETGTTGNEGGGWSSSDRDSWSSQCMQSLASNTASESAKKNYCDCVGQKLEQRYSNFNEMNTRGTYEEGIELGKQCATALTGGGSDY